MAGEAEIERLIVRLMGDAQPYLRALRGAMVETDKFVVGVGKSIQQIGGSFTRLGRTLSMKVTAPIVAMGAGSVAAFASFDKAMTESLAIMDTTEEQAQRMRDAAKEMSFGGEALQGPKELAESYFFLASAGKDAEQSLALLPAVSKFATAGAFNMATATDLLTDAQSALLLCRPEDSRCRLSAG